MTKDKIEEMKAIGDEVVEHTHNWEKIEGLMMCRCGTPFKPPRHPKDNPQG